MRKDVVYLGMIRWSDNMSLSTGDQRYNNGKKYGKKGTLYGPNMCELCNVYKYVKD